MQAAAGVVAERLGHKRRIQSVCRRNGLDDTAEGDHVVCGMQGGGVGKVDLVLSRSVLVVGCLRTQVHFLQRQADLTADVFTLVQRSDIQIAGAVVRRFGRVAVVIGLQ